MVDQIKMPRDHEMVIFTRSFDFLTRPLPVTNGFPRAQRFTFTQRLLDAALDLREHLEMANLRHSHARLQQLRLADEALARVRLYLRLAEYWKWLSPGRYRHAAGMVAEIGNLLGGWLTRPALRGSARNTTGWCAAARSTTTRGTSTAPTATGTTRTTVGGLDPYELRRELLTGRARVVVELAATQAGWGSPLPEG
ncbi:MAG: four helix bundle protein [Chloroflexota bacterium]